MRIPGFNPLWVTSQSNKEIGLFSLIFFFFLILELKFPIF